MYILYIYIYYITLQTSCVTPSFKLDYRCLHARVYARLNKHVGIYKHSLHACALLCLQMDIIIIII